MLKNNACQRDTMQVDYSQSTQMNYAGSNNMAPSVAGGCGMNMGAMNPCPMPACPPSQTCCCPPVCECPQNQVCHRVINYEVPHIMPMNTTVVNHHIYNHTYTPVYSYNEVDEVEQVYNRCNCK